MTRVRFAQVLALGALFVLSALPAQAQTNSPDNPECLGSSCGRPSGPGPRRRLPPGAQSAEAGSRPGPTFQSARAITSAETGSSRVSRCVTSRKRSASSVRSISDRAAGDGFRPAGIWAVMSNRSFRVQSGAFTI